MRNCERAESRCAGSRVWFGAFRLYRSMRLNGPDPSDGFTSSHFGFLGLGWGRLKRWSAGGARWRASEGHGFQELGPRGEHNIGAQGLQVVEEAGSGSKRLPGVPPSA